MKKLILSAMAVFAFGFMNAQEGQLKIGVHGGIPMGDIKDVSSFNFGADVAYLWDVADSFKAGIATGYTHYAGKDFEETFMGVTIEVEGVDAAFIPVAGTAQYSITENIFAGADLGYGIYVGDGDGDGGFYYQPKAGYQTDKFEIYLAYKGISVDGGTFSSFGAGFNYKF